MGRQHIELHDAMLYSTDFICFDLLDFLHKDETTGGYENWDAWHEKFTQAKSGNCLYRDRCPRYARTIEKQMKKGIQLELFD